MRFEIWFIGLFFSIVAVALGAALFELAITNILLDTVNVLFSGWVLFNSAVFVVWPEQNLRSTL